MKKLHFALFCAFAAFVSASASEFCLSPNGKNRLEFALDADGRPTYGFSFDGETVVRTCGLGFETVKGPRLRDGFRIGKVERSSSDETWRPVWGEESEIRDCHNELAVSLEPVDADQLPMTVRFRVFDDGVGFRYEFPACRKRRHVKVSEELTEFAVPGDPTVWWIRADNDSQEFRYRETKASAIEKTALGKAVQTALLLKLESGLYVNLHEAACVDYPTMHLAYDAERGTFTSLLAPNADGVRVYLRPPRPTPWRTVIVGRMGADILRSRLTLNLNEPCKIADTSWIKPMKYVGVWWGMITGRWYWSYTRDFDSVQIGRSDYTSAKPHGRHGATTERVKRYVDFAAAHHIDGVLVEGWNIGWEDWCNVQKEEVFDFTTPAPDFALPEIRDYARERGVRLIMHHETASSVRDYERQLEGAYRFMEDNGYHAVKSGYVGPIIPYGENHYSQFMNNHYLYAVKTAISHRIMVNAHEASRPTGLCRTYPNLIGNESARGTEYEAFGGQDGNHTTILPFTRLVGGPMDYTPGLFRLDLSDYAAHQKGKRVHSTLARQLALYVTLYSPLQMAADCIENYEAKPDAFRFIEDVPVDWSESRYIEAEPGRYVTIARKDRHSDNWYAGCTAGDEGHDTTLQLDFLDPGKTYEATIYADAPGIAWDHDAEKYVIEKRTVTSSDVLALHAASSGGWAISFEVR